MQKSNLICGIDEVGRGALCGPLVVAAVLLPAHVTKACLRDSKTMTAAARDEAYAWIVAHCMHAVIFVDVDTVDKKNIYEATRDAMMRSFIYVVERYALDVSCVAQLVTDAVPIALPNHYSHSALSYKNPPRAESRFPAVAAASIVAKVVRDAHMSRIARLFPLYEMERHKGYGAAVHIDAIDRHGHSFIHRRSFLSKIGEGKHDRRSQQTIC